MQMVLAFENELVLRVVRPFVNGLLGATLPSCLVILATPSKGGYLQDSRTLCQNLWEVALAGDWSG